MAGIDMATQPEIAPIGRPGRDRHAVDEFVVKPPFLGGIALAVTQFVVQPGGDGNHQRLERHRIDTEPARQPRQQRPIQVHHLVQRAGLHAAPARRALGIGQAIPRTALRVDLPHFVGVEHHLVPPRNGIAGAFPGAFPAIAAEILQLEIDGLVDLHGKIGGKCNGLEPRSHERVEHQFTDAAEFAESCPEDQGDMQDIAVGIGLRAGREPDTAQQLGHHAGDLRAAEIAAHGLGARNPVVAAGALHRVESLVDEHDHGVAMVPIDRAPVFLVRVPGILRHFADPGEVGAEKVR